MIMNIALSRQQVQEAHHLACQSIAKWGNARGYYNNRLRSHLIGKIGEIATETWLRDTGLALTPHYRDLSKERFCDISVNRANGSEVRIEVKSWSSEYWLDLGRCIAVRQYDALCQKCDLVLWCVLPRPIPVIETIEYDEYMVDVGRWSTLEDIKTAPQVWTGSGSMRKVYNYQLDEKSLRDSESLLKVLKGLI